MSDIKDTIANDVARIARIAAIPRILDAVCHTTGLGFAAVARVTSDRWVACTVRDDIDFGLASGGELPVQTTICNEIRGSGQAVIIDHVDADPAWRVHHTPLQYGFQSYISFPIIYRGAFFGTLCAIDPRPAKLDIPHIRDQFELFAELIAFHLDAQDRIEASQSDLFDAQRTAELRDQFIAVLGHDLRNPLASIDAAARLMRKQPLAPAVVDLVGLMEKSVQRMAGLIDDVLDFARARLAGGISVSPGTAVRLEPALIQVVDELKATHPLRQIRADIRIHRAVAGDSARLAQLFSNLLGNALTHGDPESPVMVEARTTDDAFLFSVANAGPPIPPAAMDQLFKPFTRSGQDGRQGLGLGLYIASAIAQAHGGTLTAVSDEGQTRFTLSIPITA